MHICIPVYKYVYAYVCLSLFYMSLSHRFQITNAQAEMATHKESPFQMQWNASQVSHKCKAVLVVTGLHIFICH